MSILIFGTLRSEGLDWVINEARESGVKLILTLTDSRGDYGGMPEYVRAVLGDGGSITDFYTSRTVRVRAMRSTGFMCI